MSADMRRELERQKWEKEAEVEVSGPTGPVHYANVQFNGMSWLNPLSPLWHLDSGIFKF